MKVVMVIPTYNEKANTSKMIESLAEIFAKMDKYDLNLLYVDGNSPDGTADVVKQYQKKYKWLHLLVETKKEGLGMAYAKGFQYAIKKLQADYIMEFDADFQHPLEKIPEMLAKADAGYDYVIGSRYIPGGSIPATWGVDRKLLSIVGNLVARTLLILPNVHDVTGGFKLSRVKGFMDQFEWDKLLSKSFAYKVHLLFYMVNKGAKIAEVPIAFGARSAGESKIIKNELQETLRVIFWLQVKNPKIQRFFKFGVVGGTGLVIQTAFFEFTSVFNHLLAPSIATIIGGVMAIISNFTLNNLWTFRDYQVTGIKILAKFVQFNLTSLIALGIQFVILRMGEAVARGSDLIIQFFYFGAIAIVLVTNYYIYNKFIWKTTKTVPSSK